MKYKKIWAKILNSEEEIKYEFSVSKNFSTAMMVLGCLAGIIILFTPGYFVGILVIIASVFYFKYFIFWTNSFAFTNKRVLIYRGWIATDLISIDYNKITDIIVDQPVIGKLTNSGHLLVNTASSSAIETRQKQKIENIDNPYETKKRLEKFKNLISN
jgi:uncharacterized membrane protein YdbT with pleckstrin-like domain